MFSSAISSYYFGLVGTTDLKLLTHNNLNFLLEI